METYKRIGAQVRLCKTAAVKAACALGGVLTSDEYAKVTKALSLLDEAASRADNRMFSDHPDLGDGAACVFYGRLGGDPISPVDGEVRRLARGYADGLFE